MNVRRPIDYSAMYAALDALMAAGLPQMELYCEIGRVVNGRTEKGAAVAAAAYLNDTYIDKRRKFLQKSVRLGLAIFKKFRPFRGAERTEQTGPRQTARALLLTMPNCHRYFLIIPIYS